LPNILAKLFYGGAVSLYSGIVTYSGECGIEKEQKRETEAELKVFVIESLVQELP
jgi:predicted nucleic acid-binding Zn ribbon protein